MLDVQCNTGSCLTKTQQQTSATVPEKHSLLVKPPICSDRLKQP